MRTFVRVCVRVDRLYVHVFVCVRMRRPMHVRACVYPGIFTCVLR